MRGFIGGLIIGLVTIAIAIVALSLLSPVTHRPVVSDGAPQPAAASDPTGSDTDMAASGSDGDLLELPPTAPGTQEAGQDNLSSLAGADTTPGDKPSVGQATGGLGEPGAAPQAPGVEVNSDVPVTPLAPSGALQSPQGDSPPTALANPAQPVVPDVSQPGSGFGSGAAPDEQSPTIAGTSDVAPATGAGGVVAAAPGGDATPDAATETATPPTAETAAQDPATDSGSQQPGAAPVPEVAQAAPQEPSVPDDAQQPSGPKLAALPQAGATQEAQRPGIGEPVVPLTERKVTPESADQPADQPSDSAALDPLAGPPIEANAEAFDNPDNRPVMAIVLIDDDASLGAEALTEFPYPLTFAVDVSAPDAAAKMARHRAAGFEVLAMVNLAGNATAQDAETNLSVWLDALPGVVGLLEGTGTGLQGNRELSDQVTAIVADTGLGLVMQAKGLNTAFKLAARDGVAAALVFRDFDGAGQSAQVMRRFLDQAAFRAGQQGGVIMLGRLRPETISALLLWGLQDRASRVALAPVSAVLKRDGQ